MDGVELAGIVSSSVVAGGVVARWLLRLAARSGLRLTAASSERIYKENNQALKDQNDVLRLEINDLTHKLETAQALAEAQQRQLDGQQAQIHNLSEMVQGVKAIADLKAHLDAQHEKVMEALDESHSQLVGLIASTRGGT